ncbi:uncharacterized protein LOC107012857 isoform X2 [Solanum pennellii]|uniref:Uncharacterized protein LOC107012857 isoform X2 n=1 Tax=Solanum pennellii TaxID=28526 RepID=A0ABM1V5H9_SOLPN|nr:uncharacterized protein LOC107012857 isoform X2 [Solanum pennellii]
MDSTSNPDTHESCRKVAIKIRMMGASVSYWNSKFIQCLAIPTYIHCIHTACSFLSFSKIHHILMQWRIPPTSRFLRTAIAPPSSATPASLPSGIAPAAPPPPAPTHVSAELFPDEVCHPSCIAKTDLRNASVDRRKRNYFLSSFIFLLL